jgi:hypothetical protein
MKPPAGMTLAEYLPDLVSASRRPTDDFLNR